MKVLWTLVKIVIFLALAIPVSIFMLAAALGILGAMLGVAFLVFKVAVIGLVGYGVFRLLARLMGGPAKAERKPAAQLPPIDPHYEAAMRELDRELGHTTSRP
jgi:ABC-type transport system involved in cytochrome c biogenesis permease subunit